MEEKKGLKWSWTSAIIGAASAVAATSILSAKPKDPTFHLISINFTSLKPTLPAIDAEVLLTVHVTNPNIAPINYSSTTMSIFYKGSLLGSAPVQAGSQPPRSCQLLRLPARLKARKLAKHAGSVVADVAKREMILDAAVDISGTARVLWWDHTFKVRVNSHVTVDPVFLDVIDQESTAQLELFASGNRWCRPMTMLRICEDADPVQKLQVLSTCKENKFDRTTMIKENITYYRN